MHISPSLVLILSLAACEHASTANQPSTLPAEVGVVEPKAAAPAPAPAPPAPAPEPAPPAAPSATPAPAPGAAMVAPKPEPAATPVRPTAKPSLLGKDCTQYRQTRAAPKWNADCERPRVTKKQPAEQRPTAGDPAPAALPEAAQP